MGAVRRPLSHAGVCPASNSTPVPPLRSDVLSPARSFEIKYTVPASRVPALCSLLDARCHPDPHYPRGHVRSLYFDTPDLRFLAEKSDGDFLKTKVRLRWYGADAGAPASGRVWWWGCRRSRG